MAAEKDIKLSLIGESDLSKIETDVEGATKKFEKAGTAADTAAGQFDKAAAEAQALGTAQAGAAGASGELATATERAGSAAVESSTEGAAAARQQATAIEGVVAAAQQEESAVTEAGEAAVKAAKDPIAPLDTLAEEFAAITREIRASTATLDSQKAALVEYEKRLAELATGYRAGGDLAKQHAEAARGALAGVRAAIEEVNAEILKQSTAYPELSEEAQKALQNIRVETKGLDETLIRAVSSIQNVETEIEEIGRSSPRAVGRAAQAVEAARIKFEELGVDGTAALERLEAELARVTAKASALTNAASDNSIRLKETGNQVGALGFAVQDLTSVLGPNAQAFGNVAARVGMMGVNVEQLKDSIVGLNVNQIGAAKGALGLGAQLTALLAVIYGSVAAGKALSETNEENSESWELMKDAIHNVIPTLDELKNRFGAAQSEIAKLIAGNGSFRALDLAIGHGRESAVAYYDLLNRGVDSLEAYRIVQENATEVTEAFTRAKLLGSEGMRLWNEAVKSSNGSAETFASILPTLNTLLDEMTEQQKKSAGAHESASEAVAIHTAKLNEYAQAEIDAAAAVARTAVDVALLEKAHNGTTEAISQAAHAITLYIAESDRNSVALGNYSEQLSAAAEGVDNMSSAERDRIKELVDLAARGNELTAVERARAAELARQLVAGQAVTAALHEQAEATRDLTAAHHEADAFDLARLARIASELDLIREAIELKERDIARTHDAADANHYLGENIEFLRMKEAELQRDQETQLTVWHATESAAHDLTAAREAQLTVTHGQITANTDLEAINQHVKSSEDALTDSMTNLTEEQRKAITEAARAASGNRDLRASADDAAIAVQRLQAPFALLPGNARDLAAQLPAVNDHIKAAAEHQNAFAAATERANVALARQLELAQQANQ